MIYLVFIMWAVPLYPVLYNNCSLTMKYTANVTYRVEHWYIIPFTLTKIS